MRQFFFGKDLQCITQVNFFNLLLIIPFLFKRIIYFYTNSHDLPYSDSHYAKFVYWKHHKRSFSLQTNRCCMLLYAMLCYKTPWYPCVTKKQLFYQKELFNKSTLFFFSSPLYYCISSAIWVKKSVMVESPERKKYRMQLESRSVLCVFEAKLFPLFNAEATVNWNMVQNSKHE